MDGAGSEGKRVSGGVLSSFRVRRIVYLIYGVLFINFSFIVWGIVGYLNLLALLLIWILLVLSFIFILYSVYEGEDSKYARYLTIAASTVSLLLFIDAIVRYAPAYGTDEIAIDTYSSYLFLHGKDPYINANMVNIFKVTNLPSSLITPLLTGGAVQYLVYPGLAVLMFIPSVILHAPSYSVPLFFNLVAFLIAYFYYQRTGFLFATPALAIAMVLNLEYAFFSISGVTDIVWVAFVCGAYAARRKPWLSGLLFGLAISFKQTPIVMLPFFMIFLLNENDLKKRSLVDFTAVGVAAFFLTNLPFIYANPSAWATNVAEIAFQPIIGVGIGPSITSFAGYLYIPAAVFTIISIALLSIFFVIYVSNYQRLRFAFFTFPVVVFLFNYRVLENYLIFWPFLFFMVFPDISKSLANRKTVETGKSQSFLSRVVGGRKLATVLIILLIAGGSAASAGYDITHSPPQSPFGIIGVTGASNPFCAPGDITMLQVSMNYTPLEGANVNETVLYRIFPNSALDNVNSLLWSSPSSLRPGVNNISIYPDTASDFLPVNTTFVLEAYYGNYSTFLTVNKAIPVNTSLQMNDPLLTYPTYQSDEPYPGWYFKDTGSNRYSYRYLIGGICEHLTPTPGITHGTPSYLYMQSAINFTTLSASNASYSYIYKGNASTTNTTNLSGLFNFTTFAGVDVSFNNGFENYWVGYSPNVNGTYYEFVNRTTIFELSGKSIINFQSIMQETQYYNWSYGDAMFSFVIGSSSLTGNLTGEFFNTSLTFPPSASALNMNVESYDMTDMQVSVLEDF